MSRHRTLRRLAIPTAALCALLLALPSFGAAQEDILGQLQTMGDISFQLGFAPVLVNRDGQSFQDHRDMGLSNYTTVGVSDGFELRDGAPLTWDGPRFSMQYAVEYDRGEGGQWHIEGEVAPDGQSVLDLTASLVINSCGSPVGCTTATDHEEATYKLQGPIPFVGTEDLTDWGSTGGCYNYKVGGDDVAAAIQEASHTIATLGSDETLIYPPASADDLPVTVEIFFCSTHAATGPQPTPVATGFWEFTSREVIDPVLPPPDFLGASVGCVWGPVASVGESSAEVSEQYEPNCDGPGGDSGTVTASCTWTPPPRILAVGESVPLSISIDSVTTGGNPTHDDPWHAGAAFCAELGTDGDAWACAESPLGLASYLEGDPDRGNLPQTAEIQWKVPPGSPGETLSLRLSFEGGGDYDFVEIIYHYQYIVVEKIPESNSAPPDDAPSDGAPPDENDDAWPVPGGESSEDPPWIPPDGEPTDVDWEGNAAGFGPIGNIPGPEGLTEVLVGVGLPAAVISVLTALGYISGSEDAPPPGSAPHVTMTDALGHRFDYDWDPDLGGYINPQTGGMLDPTLWNEYNQNVVANRAFSDRERERLEERDTAFDRNVDQFNTRIQRERREGLERALHAIEERGYSLGEDGARASAHAAELARQVRAGEPVSLDKAMAVERFISNRQAGRSVADSGERHEVTDWDVYKEQALGGARGIITGRNADGSTNWAGIGVRVTISIVSGGGSEYIFIPASAAYTYSDSREQGLTHSQALGHAAGQAALELVLGKAVQGVAAGGGRLLGTAGQLADEVAPGLAGYLRGGATGLRQEFGVLGRGVSGALSRTQQAIANRLGVGTQPALSAAERQMQWQVTKAIAENADDNLVRIFGNNGRQTLATLEAKGGLTPQQAGQIRRAISNQVDDALDDGAASAMRRFQERTGIQPEEVLVGDSGSTARGGAWSPGHSDFDRTVAPRFADADVTRYAAENGISESQAIEVLSRRYRAIYQSEVNRAINQRTGLTAQEVDINIFDRIRPGTGDGGGTYAFGYTNARQSVWGRTRVYRPGQQPYTTSGDALVDENALGIGRAGGTLPADPTRMNAGEFRSVVRQQWASAQTHNDATSLAKALDRASEPARRLGVHVDANLNRVAQQIRNNPQQQAAILRQNGLTEAEFVQRSRQTLDALVQLIPD